MWDTALKFFTPVLRITSPDHLVVLGLQFQMKNKESKADQTVEGIKVISPANQIQPRKKKKDYKPNKKCIKVYPQEHHTWHLATSLHFQVTINTIMINTTPTTEPPITFPPVFTDFLFPGEEKRKKG